MRSQRCDGPKPRSEHTGKVLIVLGILIAFAVPVLAMAQPRVRV